MPLMNPPDQEHRPAGKGSACPNFSVCMSKQVTRGVRLSDKGFPPATKSLVPKAMISPLQELLCRCNHNIPIGNPSMVPLQINRPRQLLMAIQGAAGDPGDFLVVNNGLTVLHDGDAASD